MKLPGLGIALALLACMGCSSVYTAPGADASNPAAGVVLTNAADSHLWVTRLDGHEQGTPQHGVYRLPAGRHTLRVTYFWRFKKMVWSGNSPVDLVFDVPAGTSLRLACRHTEDPGPYFYGFQYKGTWRCWLEDAGTGQPIPAENSDPDLEREATGEMDSPVFYPNI